MSALLCPAVSAPEVWFRFIHEGSPLALQFNVPCPVLEMFKVCDIEFVEPCIIKNDREVGLSPMTGGGGVTVSVTAIC